ncbi:hypothetical protein IWX47DRAFT_849245 [Phyllosticta citricarpa]
MISDCSRLIMVTTRTPENSTWNFQKTLPGTVVSKVSPNRDEKNSHADVEFLGIISKQPVRISDALTVVQKFFAIKIQRRAMGDRHVETLGNLRSGKRMESFTKRLQGTQQYFGPANVRRQSRLWEASLPFRGPQNGPWITTRDVFTFEYPTERTISPFVWGLSIYVFRPFAEFPRRERLSICLFHQLPKNSRKILLLVQDRQALRELPKADTWHSEVMGIAKSAVERMRLCYIYCVKEISNGLNDLANTETVKRLHEYLHKNLNTSLVDEYADHLCRIKSLSDDLGYFAAKLESCAGG